HVEVGGEPDAIAERPLARKLGFRLQRALPELGRARGHARQYDQRDGRHERTGFVGRFMETQLHPERAVDPTARVASLPLDLRVRIRLDAKLRPRPKANTEQ